MKNLLLLSLTAVTFVAPALGAVTLSMAETFAVLGASTVTNTGVTQIRGNVGVSPGTSIVGFPPGILQTGKIHAADAVALEAQADLTKAYNYASAMPCDFQLTGEDLGGLTLAPGVYCFDTSAQLTGALVLDFQNGSNGSFVFQIGSTLTTASASTVSLTNCTQHCLVVWQVGSSATLGTSTKFSGDIMAKASITLTTDVNLCGRALALTGAVTMDTDIVFFMGSLTPPASARATRNALIAVPEPNDTESDAAGAGRATFAFIADPAGKVAVFRYLNYITGLRTYGRIDDLEATAKHPDGSPETVPQTQFPQNRKGVRRLSLPGSIRC
jgi:hypothetical protein